VSPASASAPARTEALDELQTGLRTLLSAERRLRGRDQHRTTGELSPIHLRALFAIGDAETTAGEIAKAAQVSPAAVTAMLDDLVERGIVVRRRSDTDRRCVLVALTDTGHDVLDDARRRWRARWDGALRDVPERDLQAAARVMHAIGELFDEL
jgi:DNA-binding MarR family transcriptional regulator